MKFNTTPCENCSNPETTYSVTDPDGNNFRFCDTTCLVAYIIVKE